MAGPLCSCTAAANPTAAAWADSSPVTGLAATPQGYRAQGGGHGQRTGQEKRHGTTLTSSAAVFLVGAVHAVGVSVTAPAHGDAVPVLALELVKLAARRAVFLQRKGRGQRSAGTARTAAGSCPVAAARSGPSAPSSPGTGDASQREADRCQRQIWRTWPRSHMRAGWRGCRQRAPPSAPYLIGAIRAVVVPVALPPACDAAAIGARELALRAGPRCWGQTRGGSPPEHGPQGWQGTLADCRGGHGTTGKLFGATAPGRGWARSRGAEPRPPPSSSPGLPAGNGVHGGNTTATQTRLWQLPAAPGPCAVPPRALLQEGTQQSPGQAWQSPRACAAASQGSGDRAPRWASSWHRADLQDISAVSCQGRLLGPVPSPVVQDASGQTSQLAGRAEADRSGFRGRGCTGSVQGGRWARVLGPRTSHAWVPVVPGSRTGPILPAEPVEGCAGADAL